MSVFKRWGTWVLGEREREIRKDEENPREMDSSLQSPVLKGPMNANCFMRLEKKA